MQIKGLQIKRQPKEGVRLERFFAARQKALKAIIAHPARYSARQPVFKKSDIPKDL